MNKIINVLIFPCGAENAIEVHNALKDVVNINLFGASGQSDHGEYVFKNYIPDVPFINTDTFINYFKKIVEDNSIDVVIPTHDDVVLKLAEYEGEFDAKLLIHGLSQAQICRSKKMTYELFKNEAFCCTTYESINKIDNYPVFVKPDKGQGAKGAFLLTSNEAAEVANRDYSNMVICEYLPGEEITVDCFTNYKGQVLFIGPRVRARISNGISARSYEKELTNEITSIAEIISNKLSLNGLWYFQLKKDTNGEFKLLEVSLRVSGTMNLFRAKGINFPLLAVYNSLKYDVEIIRNKFSIEVDRALANRYKHNIEYEHIYIDLDDTITSKSAVNAEVMFFLYNALNNGKKIHLITKHQFDIINTLNELKIHKELFNTIIHVSTDGKKSDFIQYTEKSIFIDNAFAERKSIHNELGIPVFDVDAINVLINWKN